MLEKVSILSWDVGEEERQYHLLRGARASVEGKCLSVWGRMTTPRSTNLYRWKMETEKVAWGKGRGAVECHRVGHRSGASRDELCRLDHGFGVGLRWGVGKVGDGQ